MLLDEEQLGAPGGPQPPQPGTPPPSQPPGTPPPMPALPSSGAAPEPAPAQEAGPQGPVQSADASSALQGSLPQSDAGAGDPALDETIRRLMESLQPRQATPMPPLPGSVPLPGAPNPAEAAAQFGPDPQGGPEAQAPEIVAESPSFFGRAVMRLFGTDVEDDPMQWTRMATTFAGGLGGGEVGASVPGPPIAKAIGAFGGSVVGTVVGAMAPENTLDFLEMAGFLEPGSRDRLGLPDDKLKTLMLGEAALDVWTMGGITAARGLGRGLTNVMTGADAASKGLAEAATRQGVALLPVQVGQGVFARGYVSVMGRLPLVASALKDKSVRAMDQIGRMFEGIPERLGPVASMDEVSANILRDAHYTAEGIGRHFDQEAARILGLADANGVVVRPVITRRATDNLLAQLEKETPKGASGRLAITEGSQELRKFINKTTRLLSDVNPTTGLSGTGIADLPLRQMDTILKTIDQQMAKVARTGDSTTLARYETLRNAVQADAITGMVPIGGGRLGTTPQSRAIMAQFHNLDEDLTYTVNQLFQSTTARRIGAVTSTTGRAAQIAELGTRGMDKLGEVILKGDNPAAIAELQRLVQPNTMRQLGNAVMNKALDDAFLETAASGVRRFDVDKLSKSLGLDAPGSSKFAQTQALLQATGGLTVPELQTFIEFTRRASSAEIPDVSQFLARKLTFTGISSIYKMVLPVTAMAGAVVGAGLKTGFAGGLVAGLTTLGGARLVSAMISNPQSARALRVVMDTEASAVARKAAYSRAVAYGVHNMVKDHIVKPEEADNLMYNLSLYASTVQKTLERNAP
jgi:hypothetical protein